ncbi:MAG: DUF4185 domain-containing protein [Clostridiales bacterium]|nr:DUF4185 domain-containing protein [Clostridiales bacterium]
MRKRLAVLAAVLAALSLSASMAAPLPLGEDAAVGKLPDKQWELHSLKQTAVTEVAWITGEDSENKTLSRFGVWGVDLGSMAVISDTTYMFGGDTFFDENKRYWRSNVLFLIRDGDPSDGLTISGAVTNQLGAAKELLGSRKIDYAEITVIPTNIFAVVNTLYCIYMSVSHWGSGGNWECNHSGLAKSTELGQTWTKLNDAQWPGDSNFIQTANCRIGDTMYFWGIPAGRHGGVSLMKADVNDIEDMERYAYYTGLDDSGAPVWVAGDAGIGQATEVIAAPAGEISAIYNPYLGNFIITYLSEPLRAVVMREGVTPWGPWSGETVLARAADYPALYGAYMHEKYMENGGRTFYFAMSQYFPVYNILWMRADLP